MRQTMFHKEKLIRFQHCDPAGIVFFPQYLVLFHELIEDWFNEGLGGEYAEFVLKRRMGLPMVKLECDFLAPNTMGNILAMRLEVKEIGKSSIKLLGSASADGRECVRASLTVVHTSLEKLKSVPIPLDLRAAMLRFQSPAT
jgi:4-hydroxybenzoyl-CoA thioesterase